MTEVQQAECALYFWFGERSGRILVISEQNGGQWQAFAEHAPSETLIDTWEDGFWRSKAMCALSRERAIVKLARTLARRRQGTYGFMGPRQHKTPWWQPAWSR